MTLLLYQSHKFANLILLMAQVHGVHVHNVNLLL